MDNLQSITKRQANVIESLQNQISKIKRDYFISFQTNRNVREEIKYDEFKNESDCKALKHKNNNKLSKHNHKRGRNCEIGMKIENDQEEDTMENHFLTTYTSTQDENYDCKNFVEFPSENHKRMVTNRKGCLIKEHFK